MDYILNTSNIEFIKKEIGSSGLTYSHLMDELIDHVCCDTEYEMQQGLPFAKAYDVVKNKIGMDGLEHIQRETLYLIDKKYRMMKKTMKISGLIAPILLSFGSLFKIQHWPGASVLLVLGFLLLSFVFLPSAIYVNYKEVSNRTKKWTHVIGFLGTFFISVGFLFKIQHWPYAGIAITIGILMVCLLFLPMVLINRLKSEYDSVPKYIYLIAFAGFMIYLISVLFRIMHWPYASILLFTGCVLLVFIAFPLYVYHTYRNHSNISNGFVFAVIVLVWFVIPTTLISLNFSPNILHNVYEQNQSMEKDLEFLLENNRAALAPLSDNRLAGIIHEDAQQLNAFIEDMKAGILKDEIPGIKEKEQLANHINAFKDTLLSVTPDAKYNTIISQTLAIPLKSTEQPAENHQFLVHNLIFLQLNVRLAEQTALRQLNQSENVKLHALNQ